MNLQYLKERGRVEKGRKGWKVGSLTRKCLNRRNKII